MKIAFLVGYFPSLSETFVLNQITGLIDRGHDVEIYASKPKSPSKVHPDFERYNLVKHTYYYPDIASGYFSRAIKAFALFLIHFRKAPSILLNSLNIYKYGKQASSLRLLHAVIPFINQHPQYDVIHCHFGMNGVSGMMLRDLGAIQGKLSTVFHGYDLSAYLKAVDNRAYNELFKYGDLFLPISENWQRRLVELGCDQRKIFVHRMGIDCSKFTFIPRHPSGDYVLRLVTVARLVEKKGVEYAIRAIAKLKDKYPNITCKIVGDGPLKTSLESLAKELDVNCRVTFMGWQQGDEVVNILNKSDLLILPSVTSSTGDQEGIPVALMEAMAMGLPVLSTKHSGIPELVEDYVSGLLAAERDIDALAANISHLIQHSDEWTSFGIAGRRRVEEQYDINKLNDKLVETFQALQSA